MNQYWTIRPLCGAAGRSPGTRARPGQFRRFRWTAAAGPTSFPRRRIARHGTVPAVEATARTADASDPASRRRYAFRPVNRTASLMKMIGSGIRVRVDTTVSNADGRSPARGGNALVAARGPGYDPSAGTAGSDRRERGYRRTGGTGTQSSGVTRFTLGRRSDVRDGAAATLAVPGRHACRRRSREHTILKSYIDI